MAKKATAKKDAAETAPGAARIRRRRMAISSIVLVLVLGSLWSVNEVLHGGHFPIEHVQIQGDFRFIDPEKIFELVKADLAEQDFFSLDAVQLRSSVEEQAWVERVSVRRIWPATLGLVVGEQTPVARWGEDRLLNDAGQIFNARAEGGFGFLPVFIGPQNSEALMLKTYFTLEQRLAELDQTISMIVMDERRSWKVRLKNGTDLILGRNFSEDMIDRFVNHYHELFADHEGEIAVLDLRYTNGLSVRWKQQPEKVVQGSDNVKKS